MEERSGKIAKNTLLLYSRMAIVMAVSLYTGRVVLSSLGEVDYGIYNVVGGVVALFGVLSGSLTAAISRFLTYELGRGDAQRLRSIFSTAVIVQILLAIVIVILAELLAMWFVNSRMVLPDGRVGAARVVLQLSLLTFVINLISVPYNAAIVAHERMAVFAYISIFEVVGKLAIALLLSKASFDRLILYSGMLALLALIVRILYSVYCSRHFDECRVEWRLNTALFKELFGFAGWNFIGASSAILRDQGGNILLNIFCGPAVNAARGVANQVNNAVNGFVTNFMVALNPQIIKSYAVKEYDYMFRLAFNGARFSLYLLLLISLPILLNTQYLLSLWLVDVPEYTASFVRLVLVFAMSESLAYPLITIMLATGRIRTYQIVVGGVQCLNFPVSYLLLYWGASPQSVLVTAIVISVICEVVRLFMLKRMVQLPVGLFFKQVWLNVILVSVVAIIPPVLVFGGNSSTFSEALSSSLLSFLSTILSILFVGCNRKERSYVYSKVNSFKQRLYG